MLRKFGLVSVLAVAILILGGLAAYYLHPEQIQPVASVELASSPGSAIATQSTKTVDLADRYSINVPNDFSVTEVPKTITDVPDYAFQDSKSNQFSVAVLPYLLADSPIPGKCAVSTTYDAGMVSAPAFCEGLILTSWFSDPGGFTVKYGTQVTDMTTQCTMNSPCPVQVPPGIRYSVEYVFLVADKGRQALVEFFSGQAGRISSSQVQGFAGVAGLLHDSIIPSLRPLQK